MLRFLSAAALFASAAAFSFAGQNASGQAAGKPAPAPTPPIPAKPAVDPASVPDFGVAEFDGIPFIKIPAGTFRQGTTEADRDILQKRGEWASGNADEMPARDVRITKAFFLSRYEIRQKDWETVVGGKTPAAFKGEPNRPIESVSWGDANGFCRTLSEKAGNNVVYRLPSEAEWEYAARAGGSGFYGKGEADIAPETLLEYAWMNGNAQNKTQVVGTRKPNAWGLHDMLGNVWEWCRDGYSPTAYQTTKPTDPLNRGENGETERVFRGGCWFLDKRAQRVSLRGGNIPGFKSPYVGFRIVREIL